MKKILSLILALLMVVSCAPAVFAADTAVSDKLDTSANTEDLGAYEDAITFLVSKKIMNDMGDGKLHAEDNVARYMMALFVARVSTGWVKDDAWENGEENNSIFTDLKGTYAEKVYGAISYANQKGIIEGIGDNKFAPMANVTYQDALAMAVRTLGFSGSYPWGLIQKAVDLGLTKGISGVSYTKEISRGVAAQIIYNLLFATNSDGVKLALKSFGCEYGWENVVITATDKAAFAEAGEKLATDKYVEFRILNADGSLADDKFYARNGVEGEGFGFTGLADEKNLGHAFKVLFEIDADGDLAEIISAKPLYTNTLWNKGIGSTYEVDEFVKNNALVKKYTAKNYLGSTYTTKNEVIVFAANGSVAQVLPGKLDVAINWETGDILRYDEATKTWVTEWKYNQLLKQWFRIKMDAAVTGGYVAYEVMTEETFEAWYKELVGTYPVYSNIQGTILENIASRAYSSLDLFDIDGDGNADRGIYNEYRLGYVFEAGCCGAANSVRKYEITNVNALGSDADADADIKTSMADKGTKVTYYEGTCGTNKAHTGHYWLNDDFHNPGVDVRTYAVYSVNDKTGEIRVIKTINNKASDEDTSYIAKGYVTKVSAKNATITIDGKDIKIGYDKLDGTGFTNFSGNMAKYTQYLATLYNQYVKYVVLDGQLVYIAVEGQQEKSFIIVQQYAGLTAGDETYIAVDGWLVGKNSVTYGTYNLGSINNWYEGHAFYYGQNYDFDTIFAEGNILKINSKSNDGKSDIYNVQVAYENTSATATPNYTFDKTGLSVAGTKTFEYVDAYYKKIAGRESKMTANDTYILITKPGTAAADIYAPVTVYKGMLKEGWKVTGTQINNDDSNTTFVMIVDSITKGFQDQSGAGLVVLLDRTPNYTTLGHDDANLKYQLLGAANYTVKAWDIYAGAEVELYTVRNIILKEGNIYTTVGVDSSKRIIVDNYSIVSPADIAEHVVASFADADTYVSAETTFNKAWFNGIDGNWKKNIENALIFKNGLTPVDHPEYAIAARGNTVSTGKYYWLNVKSGKVADIASISANDYKAFMEGKNDLVVNCVYIYDVAAKTIVFYLYEADVKYTEPSATTWSDAFTIGQSTYKGETVKVNAKVEYTVTVNADNTLKNINVSKLRLDLVGAEDCTHSFIRDAAREGNYFAFGHSGTHVVGSDKAYAGEYYDVKINGNYFNAANITVEEYKTPAGEDCEYCNLVSAIEFDLSKANINLKALNEKVTVVLTNPDDETEVYFDFNFSAKELKDANKATRKVNFQGAVAAFDFPISAIYFGHNTESVKDVVDVVVDALGDLIK